MIREFLDKYSLYFLFIFVGTLFALYVYGIYLDIESGKKSERELRREFYQEGIEYFKRGCVDASNR